LNTMIAFIAGLLQLGLGAAFFRMYKYSYERKRDRLNLLSTLTLLILGSSALAVGVLLLAIPWLEGRHSSQGAAIAIALLAAVLQNLALPGLSWLRAETRVMPFIGLSMMSLLIALVTTVACVKILHMGLAGALWGTCAGYGIVALATLPALLHHTGLCLRLDMVRRLLICGAPGVAAFVATWMLQLSDRALLGLLGSLPAAANFAVASSFGGALATLILAPFALAWPALLSALAQKKDAPQMFRITFRWFAFTLLFAAYSFSLVGSGIITLCFPAAYQSAIALIPVIAVAFVFYGLHLFFSLGMALRGRMRLLFLLTLCAGLVNIGLNIYLIPRYGAMGAAWASLLAYTLLALLTLFVNQRLYPVQFDLGLFIVALLLGMAFALGCVCLTQTQGLYWTGSVHLMALCLYGGILLFMAKLPMSEPQEDAI
jgi:O-antigen/teichoic acid export membrane protein